MDAAVYAELRRARAVYAESYAVPGGYMIQDAGYLISAYLSKDEDDFTKLKIRIYLT